MSGLGLASNEGTKQIATEVPGGSPEIKVGKGLAEVGHERFAVRVPPAWLVE